MYHICMQVNFYMFLDDEAEFGMDADTVINYDDINDVHNPFALQNLKRSFEIETDDFLQNEIAQIILKNTIMYGNEPLMYNSLDKHTNLQNAAFLKDSMTKIERHIARNSLTDDIIEKYMISDVIATTEKNNHMDENSVGALGGIYKYENAFLEFTEHCDNYTFTSRFQCYFLNARYVQDALDANIKVEYARANPLVPMSSKIFQINDF